MRELLLFIVLLFSVQSAQSQVIDTTSTLSKQEMHDYFYSKHKKQKKTGLILLGSGLAAVGTGLLLARNADDWGDQFTAGGLLYFAGTLTTISSIPVLIISGSNKRKAQTYVQMGQHQMIESKLADSNLVSVGVKIEF